MKKKKTIKVKFCPKCNSKDVQIDIQIWAAFGFPQPWKCNKCGYKQPFFPEVEIDENGNVVEEK